MRTSRTRANNSNPMVGNLTNEKIRLFKYLGVNINNTITIRENI